MKQYGKLDLRNMDCMELMAEYPNNHFDLAIVDPPYGIGADNFSNGQNLSRDDGWHREESTAVKLNKKNRLNQGSGKLKGRMLNNSDTSWDNPPPPEYWRELFRVSVNQIIWGGNYFPLPPTRGIIVWDKCQPWENFSQVEIAWTSFDKPAALVRLSNTGGSNQERKIHPTQKRIDLYKWILAKRAKEGDKILDTHIGSGSIAIACYYAGFDLVGSELDPDYYKAMMKRIDRETAQQELF